MGIIGWMLWIIGGLVLICMIIKMVTKNQKDNFENRMGMIGKVWNICCRRNKGGHGI